MESAVEWFVAATSVVVGFSHLLRPGDWAEAFRRLHSCGRPGAFANGALSLAPGAAIVAGHGSWAWPGAVLTAFGWLLIAKGAVCFLAPDQALRSMERGSRSPRGFVAAGLLLLALAAWTCYCLWHRSVAAQTNSTLVVGPAAASYDNRHACPQQSVCQQPHLGGRDDSAGSRVL